MARKKRPLVEKYDVLNDMIARALTVQELRLFSVYLSELNPRKAMAGQVRLPLKQLYKILDLEPIRFDYLKDITDGLLTKVVSIPTPAGGYNQYPLFKECMIEQDSYGQWYFGIRAHDSVLPLISDYRRGFFMYELWNVLNLESVNQFRMYEALKRFVKRGERIVNISDLKAMLGIKENKYPDYNDFKKHVLSVCQKAFSEKTDIRFTYEPCRVCRSSGKILSVRFDIAQNPEHTDALNLRDYIDIEALQNEPAPIEPAPDLSGLGFITEPLTAVDKQFLLQAADGNIALIESLYRVAKLQGVIVNLVGWLIAMLKKSKEGAVCPRLDAKIKMGT